MNEIIQDYGKTVTPEVYIRALQGHQYIPQSDECIRRIVHKHLEIDMATKSLLDIGCGPGRLTLDIALEHYGAVVKGIDISESFIKYAKESYRKTNCRVNLWYENMDFLSDSPWVMDQQYDVLLMQGVMHHIHGKDRETFLIKCHQLLKPDGILIIGDEFIKDYATEETRRHNVCKFYLHIINEAQKGGFSELAEEEAKNLVDDVLSGEKGAGYADSILFKHIYEQAEIINEIFYRKGLDGDIHMRVHELVRNIRMHTEAIAEGSNVSNFNRGDYKISLDKFLQETGQNRFILEKLYKIGPVQQLGGMGVLVFTK